MKYLESSSADFWRLAPLSQVKSPNANGSAGVEKGQVLRVGVGVVNQRVQDHQSQEGVAVGRGVGRVVLEQREALGEPRATFRLVLLLGWASRRLAEVLGVLPCDRAVRVDAAIESLDHVGEVARPVDPRPRDGQAGPSGQGHAEGLVPDRVFELRDGGLQDVCRGQAAPGKREPAVRESERQLGLGSRERQPDAALAGEQGPPRELAHEPIELRIVERLVPALDLGRDAGREQAHRSRALPAQRREQGEVVSRRDSQPARHGLPKTPVRKDVGEVCAALPVVEAIVPEREGQRERRRRRAREVGGPVAEREPAGALVEQGSDRCRPHPDDELATLAHSLPAPLGTT